MTMEYVEKDVILVFSNKRESILRLYISFPLGYGGKKNMNYYHQRLGIILLLQQKRLMNY